MTGKGLASTLKTVPLAMVTMCGAESAADRQKLPGAARLAAGAEKA
jgi:hypothetical protein